MQSLHEIRRGAVTRLLLGQILKLAEREGILEQMRKHSPFSCEELWRALHLELGYAIAQGNRQRMICLLIDLLSECGWLRKEEGVWHWRNRRAIPEGGGAPLSAEESLEAEADGQYLFFRECLESVPAYLRGGDASLRFDEKNAVTWEQFLGCGEFRTCRSLLLELMGIENHAALRLLDLCHGPGWGLEAAICRFPGMRITAMDFTDAFSKKARERADRAQARNRQMGYPVPAITWVGPDQWKGFGDLFPFPDDSFEAVFFTCGDPYIPHGRRSVVYGEIGRVLAPEGKLGILTRCRPDADARHVASFWLRVSSLAHDFAESVCEGWEGFLDAEENVRVFSEVGFHGGVPHLGSMSFLESSLWVLKKSRCDG